MSPKSWPSPKSEYFICLLKLGIGGHPWTSQRIPHLYKGRSKIYNPSFYRVGASPQLIENDKNIQSGLAVFQGIFKPSSVPNFLKEYGS